MKVIRFTGRDRFGPNDNVATPPLAGIWHIGDERTFDRAFAEQHGRVCGDKCTGDCFAELHAAAWNIGHEKQTPPPFQILSRLSETAVKAKVKAIKRARKAAPKPSPAPAKPSPTPATPVTSTDVSPANEDAAAAVKDR